MRPHLADRTVIAAAMAAAPDGQRTATARRIAGRYRVSAATIFRLASGRGPKRPRAPRRPEYHDWTRAIVARQARLRAAGRLHGGSLAAARRLCIADGTVPPAARRMPLRTMYAIARTEP